MIRFGSITQRLMTYHLGGAGAILLLIVVTDYFTARSIFVRLNETRELYLARSSAKQIDDAFVNLQNVARGLAAEIQSQQVQAGEQWQGMADLVLRGHENIYGVMLAGGAQSDQPTAIPATYRYRTQGQFNTTTKPDVHIEEWYYLATELKHPVWTSPYDGGAGYTLMISYAVPFYSTVDGQPVLQGVVKIDVDLALDQSTAAKPAP